MSSHTYNLRKCIETEGKFCDIKKNYKAPRCPSSAAPNSVISSSSQRTQSLLNGTLKESSEKITTINSSNINIESTKFGNFTFQPNTTYNISFKVSNTNQDTDFNNFAIVNGAKPPTLNITIPKNSSDVSFNITLEIDNNIIVNIGELNEDGDTVTSNPSSITVSNIIISYEQSQTCVNICDDTSGNLKKNTLLYNGSYAQYLKNNYNA